MNTKNVVFDTYEANWGEIVSALADGLAVLEGVCDLLGRNEVFSVCCVKHGCYNEKKDVDDILSHGERITFRIAASTQDGYPRPQRSHMAKSMMQSVKRAVTKNPSEFECFYGKLNCNSYSE